MANYFGDGVTKAEQMGMTPAQFLRDAALKRRLPAFRWHRGRRYHSRGKRNVSYSLEGE